MSRPPAPDPKSSARTTLRHASVPDRPSGADRAAEREDRVRESEPRAQTRIDLPRTRTSLSQRACLLFPAPIEERHGGAVLQRDCERCATAEQRQTRVHRRGSRVQPVQMGRIVSGTERMPLHHIRPEAQRNEAAPAVGEHRGRCRLACFVDTTWPCCRSRPVPAFGNEKSSVGPPAPD